MPFFLLNNHDMAKKNITPSVPVSDDSMERLARIMNDSPTIIKLYGTEWEIRALRPGTQWLIAEEACKIVKQENVTMGDVIRLFAVNMPSVTRVITLALLNNKKDIYGERYQQVYDTLMWGEYNIKDWAVLLSEILNLIDVDFFLASTNVVKILRQNTLDRKTTMEEQRQYLHARNGEE